MSARSVSTVLAALLVTGGAFAQTDHESVRRLTPRPNYDASRRSPIEIVPVWSTERPGNAGTAGGAGTVSLRELQHQVPGKAVKEWDRAERARQKGDLESAKAHLRKAIQIDPEFVAARNNLAAMFLMDDRSDEALPLLEECIKLDPHSPTPTTNLAVAYLMQKRFDSAELAARRALDLDRTGTRVRMVLGLTLVIQDKFTEEALRMFHQAEPDYPQATLLSARVLAGRGERAKAEAAIRAYLQSGDKSGIEIAQEWLGVLRKFEQTATASVR